MARRKPKQLDFGHRLQRRTWGGRRKGAGRPPKGRKAGVPHDPREKVTRHTPVLVTMKLKATLGNMKTPREVRNALVYVINNARRHGLRLGDHPDPLSSGYHFDGWRRSTPPHPYDSPDSPAPVASPKSWLRRQGWRRHRLLDFQDRPGPVNSGA